MRIRVIAAVSLCALAICAPVVSEAKVLLGEPTVVSEPGSGWPVVGTDVAYDATSDRYLVVWTADQGIFGRVLDGAGHPVAAQFRISGRSAVRVVRGPAGEFLVLSSERPPGGDSRLVARRLGPRGEIRGGPFVVSDQAARGATVAYNAVDEEYLVAWATDRIHVQRLGKDGTRLGTPGVVSAGPRDVGAPVVAHNAVRNEYLVAWDQREGAYSWERRVRGQRLDAAGAEVGADDFPVPAVPDTLGPQGDGLLRWVWVEDLEHDPGMDRYLLLRTYAGTGIDGRYIAGSGALGEGAPVPTHRSSRCCLGEYIVNAPDASFDVQESRFYWAWSEDLDGSTWLVDTEIFAGPLDGDEQVSSFGRGQDPARDAGSGAIVYNSRADEHLVVFSGNPGDDVFARRIGDPPDRRAPIVSISARKRQHVVRRRAVIVRVRCDEPCSFTASARIALPRASRLLGVARAHGSLAANERRRVKLKLSRSNVRSLGRALKRRRSLRVGITVTASDAAGNRRTVKRTIRARR